MNFSKAIASSIGNGIANDDVKDKDNGIWLEALPSNVQKAWCERFYCIRWVDRLAEQDLIVQPGGEQFFAFFQAWKSLYRHGSFPTEGQRWEVLEYLFQCWYADGSGLQHRAEIEAWNEYMEAIVVYHKSPLIIDTLSEYERMLDRLAGSCFQLLPCLEKSQRAIARQFGWVDQFYNNLRDLYEDAQQGVCYFPTEVLAQHGLTRDDILTGNCLKQPGYQSLMQFWVEDYLPELRKHHLSLLQVNDLHPAWQRLTAWFMHRYQRIERVMKHCQYDFVEFSDRYWCLVKAELAEEVDRTVVLRGH